jgi:predicted outer membrane repeat protein
MSVAGATVTGKVKIYNNEAGSAAGIWTNGSLEVSGEVELYNNRATAVSGYPQDGPGGGWNHGGGAIWANTYNTSVGNVYTIKDKVKIYNNSSVTDGGAIFMAGHYEPSLRDTLRIEDEVQITGNTAARDGGGIASTRLSTSNSVRDNIIVSDEAVITDNTAGRDGGGIHTKWTGTGTARGLNYVTVGKDVTFARNTAGTATPRVAPVDVSGYETKISKTNDTWSVNPESGSAFTRGWNNYDISYQTVPKGTILYKWEHDGSMIATQTLLQGDTRAEAPTPDFPDRFFSEYRLLGWYVSDTTTDAANWQEWDFSLEPTRSYMGQPMELHLRRQAIDFTPPATSVTVPGGTYKQAVVFNFEAHDVDVAGFPTSGLDSTWYSINGSPQVRHAGPVTLDESGRYVITYYSQDKAGNVEAVKTVTYVIDITKVPGGGNQTPGTPNPADKPDANAKPSTPEGNLGTGSDKPERKPGDPADLTPGTGDNATLVFLVTVALLAALGASAALLKQGKAAPAKRS